MPPRYEAHRLQGDESYPTLYLDDVSGISFLVDKHFLERRAARERRRAETKSSPCPDEVKASDASESRQVASDTAP